MIQLKALSKGDLEKVRDWRNQVPETLRTPFLLTKEMQEQYYHDVICNRDSNTRYWGIHEVELDQIGPDKFEHDSKLIGYGGIENIIWDYRIGEISIIMNPAVRGKGFGTKAVGKILDEAFKNLGLEVVWGECYLCGAVGFWEKYCKRHERCFFTTTLPRRKFYDEKYWDSFYFCFTKDGK
jgi:RimJ/RimL family protein N-acetyltransferase